MTMEQAAHLIVDMQGHFLKTLKQEEAARLCTAIDGFVQKTATDIHHIYVRTVAESDWFDTAEESAAKELAIPVRRSLCGDANACFSKKGSSAMTMGPLIETDLPRRLRTLGVKTLYISGLYHSLCVWQTALDAKNMGFDVAILEDLTGESPHIEAQKMDRNAFPRITAAIAAAHGIAFIDSRAVAGSLHRASRPATPRI